MHSSIRRLICRLPVALLFVLTPAIATAQEAEAEICDRACLSGMITAYVDAILQHDPSSLNLSKEVRFTENSKELTLGEGAWTTLTGKGSFRQDYLDTDRQIAAAHIHFMEGENHVLYSLLLSVEDAQIAGIETLVQRVTPESRFQPTMLGEPLARMNDPIPAGDAMTREDMIRTALTYTEGLRVGDFVPETPFGPRAYRIENGVFMAGDGCPRESCPDIQTQEIIVHPDIRASVAAVDRQAGIVLLWMNFGYTGGYGDGNALVTFEAFKVYDHEIHVVHAFFTALPYRTARGWLGSDSIPLSGIQD